MTLLFLGSAVVGVSGLFVFAVHRASKGGTRETLAAAGVVLAVLGVNWLFSQSDMIRDFDRVPPPFLFFFLFIVGSSFAIAFSRLGTLLVDRISIAALVGYQGFRILAELLLASAYHQGLAPRQMTFEGYNFDIVTAITALGLAWYLRGRKKWNPLLVRLWNGMGITALMVIAFIAVTSMPSRLRLFMDEPSNIWVTYFPYILLPGVLVVAALTGHLLVARKLGRAR
jgi:hypothetical protein